MDGPPITDFTNFAKMAGTPVPGRINGSEIPDPGLLEGSPFPVFVLDWRLRMVFINRAFRRITGFHERDMTMGRLYFRVHPADRIEAESSIIMAMVGRMAFCRCRVKGWNRTLHLLELRFSPVLWKGSRMVIAEDVRLDSSTR